MGSQVRLQNVTHRYGETEESAGVEALRAVSLEISAGDFAIVMGPSGSGKSTLLNLIGAVDRPTSGALFIGDVDTAKLDETRLTLLRRSTIGYVFQFFHLVPTLTVEENVGFPLALIRCPRREIDQRVDAVLQRVGLEGRARHYPNQLSGGEMQRVAIGRAVIHQPPLILADELTGNLDSSTGESILHLLREVHATYRPTIVMATHSDHAASFGDYIIRVVDGTLQSVT